MDITSASQQFAVAEQKTIAYSRKQQLLSKAVTDFRPTARPEQPQIAPTVPTTSNNIVSEQPDEQASMQADDKQGFNAYQTFGMVKHILAQLSAHNRAWLQSPMPKAADKPYTEASDVSAVVSQQSAQISASMQRESEQYIATTEWELGYQAVQASFSGEITLANGNAISFDMDFSMEVSWARYSYSEQKMQDPLIVSLSGNAVELSADSSKFDLLSDGSEVKLPQLAAQQFYLAYDRNRDNQINNGSELFGVKTGQGFKDLAKYDDNGNGFIDPSDDIWQYLYLWRPEQSLQNMQQAKLGAISLESVPTVMPLYNNKQQLAGQLQRSGIALTAEGKPALLQQIDLVV